MPAPASSPIRVFLIDDHRSVLWGLERLIESSEEPMQLVGSTTTYHEALTRLDEAKPDVILLDMDLGTESGLDAIPLLQARSSARILILTGLRDESVHDQAVVRGACGVVEKEADAGTILAAIAQVHAGQLWLDRDAIGRVFVELSHRRAEHAADPERQKIESLTERERQIVAATATSPGDPAKVIADRLNISENTLRNHLTAIYDKLGVANRLELFAYSQKHGLDKSPA